MDFKACQLMHRVRKFKFAVDGILAFVVVAH